MNEDIRISVDFLDHHKTARLEKELGFQGVKALLRLWFYAAKYRADGHLINMDKEDIIIASRWEGDPEIFFNALTHNGKAWLEWKDDHYYLHHWIERNGYAAHAEKRSEVARKAAEARWNRKEKQSLDALSIDGAMLNECNSNADAYAPNPYPYPDPLPNPKDKKKNTLSSKDSTASAPFAEIISYLNTVTGKHFTETSRGARKHIHARCVEGFHLDDFKRVVDVKAAQWLHDPAMNKFLRPETLFSPKFDGYLNESVSMKREEYSEEVAARENKRILIKEIQERSEI